ncbi:hypothetical protein ACJIZ3_008377 [Penstemon smallii]|uniref:Uncharacterized protein n=1 Tax=Penstemon smallii TaxID=265156 RepID=A0ABD3TAK2_9LAMI
MCKYYVAPSEKRLCSMVELDKFFEKNPEFLHGVINTSMFSFQAPVPLDENYIAKRRSRAPSTSGSSNTRNVPLEVNQNLWIVPFENKDMNVGVPDGDEIIFGKFMQNMLKNLEI